MKIIDFITLKIQNNSFLLTYYVIFAGIATVLDISILYFLTEFLSINYFWSGSFGYVCGMLTNFSLNKYHNFQNKSKQLHLQFGLFLFVALIGLFFNQVLLYFLVEKQDLWYVHSKIISVIIVMFWSFIGHKKITFKILK